MDTYVELDQDFPEEYRELRENVHKFAKEVLRPTAIALDKLADPADVIAPGSMLWSFLRKAYALGYHVAGLPKELGGLGIHGVGHQVFSEELGWGGADLAISLGVTGFPFSTLATGANQSLIDEYVRPFIADREARFIGSWPVTEPEHGSDWVEGLAGEVEAAAQTRTSIKPDGDGYVIDGQKAAWVSNGTIATHGLVYLKATDAKGRTEGGSVAFVPFDLPGVSKGKPLNKLGQRALNQGEIFFDHVRIPKEFVVVGPDAFPLASVATLTGANCGMSATFTGVARSAFEAALDYSKQRVQGGQPICHHQLVQRRLFDMFTKVEACRALSRAAMGYAEGSPLSALEYAIAAKTFCTQASFEVASDALQLFGGNGLSKEYPIEKIFRDARASLIEDGTNDVLSLEGARRIVERA